jgi:hypothetical protein
MDMNPESGTALILYHFKSRLGFVKVRLGQFIRMLVAGNCKDFHLGSSTSVFSRGVLSSNGIDQPITITFGATLP